MTEIDQDESKIQFSSELANVHDVRAVDVLALAQVPGIGFAALRALAKNINPLSDVWNANPDLIKHALHGSRIPRAHQITSAILSDTERFLDEGQKAQIELDRQRIRLVTWQDKSFPESLRTIPDPPLWLFVLGNAGVLNARSFVAVVGTRSATPKGISSAEQVTWLLINNGFGIVSGLAEGIDEAAHRVAGRYEAKQVAFLGTGIHEVFPASTRYLREQIVETGGAVVSEYLPNDRYGRSRFVERNRLQVGLSVAICPVEGRLNSGTMHTIRFAMKYGREMFSAVRGDVPSTNEIVGWLAERGSPIFDLSQSSGKLELRQYLDALPGKRWPLPKRPTPERLFRSVIKALDDIESFIDLSNDEKIWILNHIAKRLGVQSNPQETNDVG